MCKISAQYVKECMRKVWKTGGRRPGRTESRMDGESDGRTDGDPDGHHHTIIRPVWRRAYKKLVEFQSLMQVNSGNPDHTIFNLGKYPLDFIQNCVLHPQRFQRRSWKCLSQSEARAAILFYRSAWKTQTWQCFRLASAIGRLPIKIENGRFWLKSPARTAN